MIESIIGIYLFISMLVALFSLTYIDRYLERSFTKGDLILAILFPFNVLLAVIIILAVWIILIIKESKFGKWLGSDIRNK